MAQFPFAGSDETSAAEGLLRSLGEYGVEYVFGNFGTDHPSLLEAAEQLRANEPEAIPDFVICPHEISALSAAHGCAIETGQAQAVVVHVDVGTQNLGSMVHNAHRGNAPVFIIAGLAPISHAGHPSSRSSGVHYLQDVYDQEGIVREFCRWATEYRPPADPDEFVARGLELASTPPRGPTYMTATREALAAQVDTTPGSNRAEGVAPTPADPATVERVAEMVDAADAPLVVTSKIGMYDPEESVDALLTFAEAAGAGVIEARPTALSFPRTNPLHVGFSRGTSVDEADLVVTADTDIPWEPGSALPGPDATVVQIDVDPNKPAYPQWNLQVDHAIRAAPAPTLEAIAERVDSPADDQRWRALHQAKREERADRLASHEREGRFTPQRLSAAINDVIDEDTVVVNETTTNQGVVREHLELDRPGSYFEAHGSGLGWAPGAGIGVKLARPDATVLTLVGDGSYVFGQPTSAAWISASHDAPTLTVVYNNGGWGAVRAATLGVHPDGDAAKADVRESKFSPRFDLSHAAKVVDAHTAAVERAEDVPAALAEAIDAVESGRPAVIDARIESI